MNKLTLNVPYMVLPGNQYVDFERKDIMLR
jgi:hypothetical protein